MSRALVVLLSIVMCAVVVGCSGDANKDATKDATDKKDDSSKPNPHAPSKEPLVIVPDIVAASDHVKEIFANPHARVLTVEMHQGESLPLHESGPNVIYALTDLDVTIDKVHGDHTHGHKVKMAAGKVRSDAAGAYGFKNQADGDARFVVFLRSDGDVFKASVPAGSKPIAEVSDAATELDSFDDFRAILVELPPGGKIAQHFALNRLIYALADGNLTLTDSDGNAQPHEFKKGDVHFHAAGLATIENHGDQAAKFLIIEMKR